MYSISDVFYIADPYRDCFQQPAVPSPRRRARAGKELFPEDCLLSVFGALRKFVSKALTVVQMQPPQEAGTKLSKDENAVM